MANFPPWWKGSELHHSEIEMVDFDPEEIDEEIPAAPAEEIVEGQAQRVAVVQNNVDAAEIGAVVGMLAPLLFLFIFFLMYCGSGPSYRGGGFRDGSANLRNDASGRLQGARPIAWSGARGGAADSYDGKVGQQQAHVEMIAAADQQIADTVDTQADQVEQGRQGLEAAILALLGGIAVAQVMEAQWKAAIPTPAATALAAALLTFVKSLMCITSAAVLGILFFMVDAGTQNAKDFNEARDQYKRVFNDVSAKMLTGEVSPGEVSTTSASTAASFSDIAGRLAGVPDRSADMNDAAGVVFTSPANVETLSELAELCRKATGLPGAAVKASAPERASENRLIAQVHLLAAMAQPVAPAAVEEDATPADGAIAAVAYGLSGLAIQGASMEAVS